MIETFSLGDTVQMKKPHACGENAWIVIRVGADVKIRCKHCGRIVMLERADFVRAAKRILVPAPVKAADSAEDAALSE